MEKMGVIKAAIGDAVLTFMWVFSVSTLRVLTTIITSTLGIQSLPFAPLIITTILIFLLVFIYSAIGAALGGASFNPTGTASFYAAGLGPNSLTTMAVRFPAQAAGAVAGALAIVEVMPAQYKHMLGGPSLKVELHTGAIAEGVLTFVISFIVLFIIVRGPRSSLLKTGMITIATVTMVIAGSGYTGPAMNPANAFGWAYVNNRHNTWDHFYVYWICPFVGATFAAWVFRFLFPPPAKKQKKA